MGCHFLLQGIWPRDRTWVFHIAGRLFTVWATKEAKLYIIGYRLNTLQHLAAIAITVCTRTGKLLQLSVNKAAFGAVSTRAITLCTLASDQWMGPLVPCLGSLGRHLALSPIQSGKGHLKEHPWEPCNLLTGSPMSLAVGASHNR